MPYSLPTDPSIPNEDRLGLLDTEDATQVEVLEVLLQKSLQDLESLPSSLIQDQDQTITGAAKILCTLIEDIAYVIHTNSSLNTDHLKEHLIKFQVPVKTSLNIISVALQLPKVFETCTLPVLSADGETVTLNGYQIRSLLAHQFLGTLSQPSGTDWGLPVLTSWFSGEPRCPNAVEGYLATILDYFAAGGYTSNENFTYSMYTAATMPDPSRNNKVPNVSLNLVAEESEPSGDAGSPFVLVAAHSQPGPGPSATQEERLQAAAPSLCVSALVTPLLPDGAAVVTSPFPVHASWKGHNRSARLDTIYKVEERPMRCFILADALQLDEMSEGPYDELKDLVEGRVEREVKKLYAAFWGAKEMQKKKTFGNDEPCVVEAGAWGCGAFGGNVLVKVICMLVAAGLAGIEVKLTLLEERRDDVESVTRLLDKRWNTGELWGVVTAARRKGDIQRALS